MRAAILTAPDSVPVCAEFPDPEPLPGHDLLELVGAGLHQVVRSLATGHHYGSSHAYPLVPGVDAVARTADGRLVYTGWPRAPWGTVAERLSYVQIGAVAGSDAAVPATLLRSRRIRISGSGECGGGNQREGIAAGIQPVFRDADTVWIIPELPARRGGGAGAAAWADGTAAAERGADVPPISQKPEG